MNRVHLTALLVGLVAGLAGSLADNALGDSSGVTLIQILLWVCSAALLLRAFTGLLREHGAFRARRRARAA